MIDNRTLRSRGEAAAAENRSACRKLVLIYSGVLAALTLGLNGLYILLDSGISGTGGLGGLGMRSVLQTMQQILAYVNLIFTPFWTAGFQYAMIVMVRRRSPQPRDLLEGFHRIGRILGYLAFQFLLLVSVTTTAVNLGMTLFALSPMGAGVGEQLGLMETAALVAMVMAVFLPLYGWLSYSFRMALYLVMDGAVSGVRAHFDSMHLMRGHKWQLFKLDLSFWWYYALGLLATAVGYLDLILGLMGVKLAMDPTVLFFITMVVYCLIQLAVSLWKKCPVDAAYVLAFEAITHPEEEPTPAQTDMV